jgi:hypothetical protein
MPPTQRPPDFDDYEFDTSYRQPRTKGYASECTIPHCAEPPVVSRQWLPSEYPSWWSAYCERHARETAERARARSS